MAVANRSQYAALIKELLPPGPAWPRDDMSSPLAVVIDEAAGLCADMDAQAGELIEESDPETAAQSFADWETDWGLPDECALAFGDAELTFDRRRAMLLFKASLEGGQSAAFFRHVAELLGRRAIVEDLRVEGDPSTYHKWRMVVTDPDGYEDDGLLSALAPVETTIDAGLIANVTPADEVLDQGVIGAGASGMNEASVQMGADDPLSTWGDSLLECVVRRLKPAHTTVYFSYP